MRHLTLSVALAVAALAAASPSIAAPLSLEEATQRLQRDTPALMAVARVPGLAIALVADNRLAWHGTFGLANSATGAPVTQETVFEAASLSKPVFAFAVLQLVDAGVLELDTPLARYLPGGYDVGDKPRLAQVTARHVLSHRTGFPNWRPKGAPLMVHFTPGERFSYSGEGFVYLARAVERLTGESTEHTVKRLVFEPLGMLQSTFLWQDSHEEDKAFGHDARGEPRGQARPTWANPAAGLTTTAPDYARFLVAMMNGERLKPDTAAQLLRAQVRVGPFTSSIGRPSIPLSDEVSWGLGVGLQEREGDEVFWHWGDNGNSKAFAWVSRTQRRGLVFFANSVHGMAIAGELVALALGDGRQPALDWLNYRR
ncbi:MAG: beta-lactamase family protein [Burkholderiales bacterium]|nr:beta-lactamase family protein [Burkholderiales bacterium]